MVRDVGQRGKWGGTGRLTANFSLLATPDGAANGRRTNVVMPNGHHSLRMPPHGPIFPYSLRFPHHPTHFHTLSGAFRRVSAPVTPFSPLTGAIRARFAPVSVPAPTQTAVQERWEAISVPARSSIKHGFVPTAPKVSLRRCASCL